MSFIGLTGFYRGFIKSYAKIAAPNFDYMQKKTGWSDVQTEAFEKLKESLMAAPVMTAPIYEDDYKFRLSTDASDECIGFILEQLDPLGKLLGVIRYGSTRLDEAQVKYPIREKEFLAVIVGLKKYRSYLNDRPFQIRTDHHSLTYIKQQDLRINRVSRWIDQLIPFDFDIDYIKGDAITAADALSRPNEDMKQSISEVPKMVELMQLHVTDPEAVELYFDAVTITPPSDNLITFSPSEDLKEKIIKGYENC